MGLIHGNHFHEDTETYLLEQLRAGSASEVLQHGACLGLGLSSVGTHSARVTEEMKQVLHIMDFFCLRKDIAFKKNQIFYLNDDNV